MKELLFVVRHNSFYHHGLSRLLDLDPLAAEVDEHPTSRRNERPHPRREREPDEIPVTPPYMRSSRTGRPVPVARVLVQGARSRAGTHEHLPGKGVRDFVRVLKDR